MDVSGLVVEAPVKSVDRQAADTAVLGERDVNDQSNSIVKFFLSSQVAAVRTVALKALDIVKRREFEVGAKGQREELAQLMNAYVDAKKAVDAAAKKDFEVTRVSTTGLHTQMLEVIKTFNGTMTQLYDSGCRIDGAAKIGLLHMRTLIAINALKTLGTS
ncbi:hypothetical protein K0U07_03015 [bacterium]|nr:hypothetical protein [bacterium]